MNWFWQALKRTFVYKGRARRAEFGWFNLISALISLVLNVIPFVLFSLGGKLLAEVYQSDVIKSVSEIGIFIFALVFQLFSIITTFTQFSLSARRLHDLGFSGWWQLAVYLSLPITILLHVILEMNVVIVGLMAILSVIAYLIFLCILLFKDGQRFNNKYGEDPKAEKVESIVQNESIQADIVFSSENKNDVEETPEIEDKNKPKITFSHIAKK